MVMGQEGDTHVDDVGQLHQDQGLHGFGWRAHCHHQHLGGDSQGGPEGRGTGCHRDGDTAQGDSRGSPTHLGGGRISPSVRYNTAPMTKWDDSSVSAESTCTCESAHGCSRHAGGNVHMAQTHGHMQTHELAGAGLHTHTCEHLHMCFPRYALSQMCIPTCAQPQTHKLTRVCSYTHTLLDMHVQTCANVCCTTRACPVCTQHQMYTHICMLMCAHTCTLPDVQSCMCTRPDVKLHMCMLTHVHTHALFQICTHTCAQSQMCSRTCTQHQMCTCTCMLTHMCTHRCAEHQMCTHMCMLMCTHMHTPR